MSEQVEQEILNGRRAFVTAQALLAGEPLQVIPKELVIGWHDTATSPETGAFALVSIDSGLTDLIGEVVLVSAQGRSCFAYVLGSADVPTPVSLARRAFASLAILATEELDALVQVIA